MRTLLRFVIIRLPIFILFPFVSCNVLKHVEKDEYFLVSQEVNAPKPFRKEVNSYISKVPNKKVLGLPLSLYFFNISEKDKEARLIKKLKHKPRFRKRMYTIFSKKQTLILFKSLGNLNNIFKKNEPPSILRQEDIDQTKNNLEVYFKSQGYLYPKIDYLVDTIAPRKLASKINFELGKQYIISKVKTQISNQEIDSIYKLYRHESFIKKDNPYNLLDLEKERNRLTTLFRNNGMYHFRKKNINFKVDVLETKLPLIMTTIVIDTDNSKPTQAVDTSKPVSQIHRYDKTNIYLGKQSKVGYKKNKTHLGLNFYYKNKLRIKPNVLKKIIQTQEGALYKDQDYYNAISQLYHLNMFDNIRVNQVSENNNVRTDVELILKKKYLLGLDFDVSTSFIQNWGLSFNTSIAFNNLFSGGERLEISPNGVVGIQRSLTDDVFDQLLTQLGGTIDLRFPKIFFPIRTHNLITQEMMPKTTLSVGASFQKNIGLDRQSFNATLGYSWKVSERLKYSFEVLDIQFIRNINPENFFNIYSDSYDSLNRIALTYQDELNTSFFQGNLLTINTGTDAVLDILTNRKIDISDADFKSTKLIEERKNRLTSNNLITTTNFLINYSTKLGFEDNSFFETIFKIAFAGNTLGFLDGLVEYEKNAEGENLIFGIPYTQYIKTEFGFTKYISFSKSTVFAFNFFIGSAIPYVNSKFIPFTRSYFAGGSNDNRGWQVYSLGPGKTNSINDFNEANFKIKFNSEFRFPILGNINGAIFSDIGNIWHITDNASIDQDAVFNGLDSLGDLAVSTGFGLRLNVGLLILRFDYGLKTYNPALPNNQRWGITVKDGILNFGLNYPF